MTQDAMRESFEAWYKNEYPGADINHPTGAPVYSWSAYQAAHQSREVEVHRLREALASFPIYSSPEYASNYIRQALTPAKDSDNGK